MELDSFEYDFSLLPPHVIAQILNSLPFRQILNVSLTCKSWYFASCDPMISRRAQVRIQNNFDNVDQLSRPFRTLVLSKLNFSEFNYKDIFAKFGQHITKIKFLNCLLSANQFADCLIVMTNLSHLEIIPIDEIFEVTENSIESSIATIEPILNRIKHFSVRPNSKCGGLMRIMSMMPNLTTLCVEGPFKDLFAETYSFKLDQLKIVTEIQFDSDFFIRYISKNSALLANLNFFELHCWGIEAKSNYGEHFKVLCNNLANLKIFTIHSIGEHELKELCERMPNLIELNIIGITTNKIQMIGSLKNLKKLKIKHFNEIDGGDEQADMFGTLENLKDLELDFNISDELLNVICTNCKNLNRLTLTSMRTHNLEVLYKNLVQLTHLDLTFVRRNFEPLNMEYDITNVKLLEHLEVNALVPGMSMELIEKLPKLRSSSVKHLQFLIRAKVMKLGRTLLQNTISQLSS